MHVMTLKWYSLIFVIRYIITTVVVSSNVLFVFSLLRFSNLKNAKSFERIIFFWLISHQYKSQYFIYNQLLFLGDDRRGEDEEEPSPSCGDYIMHFLTLFWKIIFAFIPPTGKIRLIFTNRNDQQYFSTTMYLSIPLLPHSLLKFSFIHLFLRKRKYKSNRKIISTYDWSNFDFLFFV